MTKIEKRGRGRPLTYTKDKGDRICKHLADGKSLTFACADVGIQYETCMRWAERLSDFQERLTRARRTGLMCIADGLIDLAQDDLRDHHHKRLEIDTRKWLLSKFLPQQFGERRTVDMHQTVEDTKPVDMIDVANRIQAILHDAKDDEDDETDT
jgi:hypothetical protein